LLSTAKRNRFLKIFSYGGRAKKKEKLRKRSRKDRIERERGGVAISDNVIIGVNCLCGKKKLIEKMQNI